MSKGNPRIIFRISPEEKKTVERVAAERGANASEWIRDLVRAAIKRLARRKSTT